MNLPLRTFMANHTNNHGRRRAMAVVELAVCMPLLVLVLFATIEACSMLHLKQTLKITAFEGVRVGLIPSSTTSTVEDQCQALLDDRNVQGYSMSMLPTDPQTVVSGDYFQVTITANYANNSLMGGWLYGTNSLSESVSLRVD
jgi:Flp pilus assembly protein TadG